MESNYKKRLASLAVFRRLYDDNKDIYTILDVFVKDIIQRNKLISFSSTEIKNQMRDEYGFNSIPEGVISATLRRSYKKQNGIFYIDQDENTAFKGKNIQLPNTDEISEANNNIINSLIHYVENKLSAALEDCEKEILTQSFCEFIIGGTVSKYEEYISAFIVSKHDDLDFTKRLNTIKEGVVLYSGIQYNDNLNEIGSWKSTLTLYLEQDVIFHLAGYNGELYQNLFDDFYDLIQEINETSKKPIIRLKYFTDVKDNIDYFFGIAERIIDGIDRLDYSNNAMCHIVKGCASRSDVITKKAQLFNLLNEKSIIEDEQSCYFDEATDQAFNIETEELFSYFEKEMPDVKRKKILQSLNFLTYINVKRKGANNVGFDSIRHILLSGNSTTIRIAFDDKIKHNGNVPYATYLDYITNKFWFKLNKGFGDSNYPKTFDIITRAQIILSSQISVSVAKEFEQLEKLRKAGKLSDDDAKQALSLIRQQSKHPEDICINNVDDALEAIRIDDIEKLIREAEIEKQKAAEQVEKNDELKNSLEKEQEAHKKSQTLISKKEQENKALFDNIKMKTQSELNHINTRIEKISKRKAKADTIIEKKIKRAKLLPLLIIIFYIVLIIVSIFLWSWEVMEPITYILGLIVFPGQYIWNVILKKSYNPLKWFEGNFRDKITIKEYEDRDVVISDLEELEESKKKLTNTLNLAKTNPSFKMSKTE